MKMILSGAFWCLMGLYYFMEMPDNFRDLLFPELLEPVTYKNDALVFKPGDVADTAYWLVKGYIRTYRKHKPEEDCERYVQITENVSVPGKIFLLEDSFICGATAGCFMEITKGSTVVSFSSNSFVELAKKMPEITSLALKIISSSRRDNQKKTDICKLPGTKGYAAILNHFGAEVESYVYLCLSVSKLCRSVT